MRAVVIGALALSASALAQGTPGAPAERTLIYVDEIGADDKALAQDAQAITTSLCSTLAKDRRLEVMCAPDVKQILAFAATGAMIGTTGGPAAALEERLGRVKHVVAGNLRKDGAAHVLVLRAGPRSEQSTSAAMFTEKPALALEEKTDKPAKLLERLPALSSRIVGALLAPPAQPPPAPLEKPAP